MAKRNIDGLQWELKYNYTYYKNMTKYRNQYQFFKTRKTELIRRNLPRLIRAINNPKYKFKALK